MEYSIGAAIGAGLVATTVMTVILYMGIAIMPRQMPMNLLYMLGTMVTRSTERAYVVGAMVHAMMGVAFALVHVGIYQAIGVQGALAGWGLLLGFAHWSVVGMGMGMVGAVHPLMRSGGMQAPGLFVKNYPAMTVMGFLMLHLVFGLVVAVLYQALV